MFNSLNFLASKSPAKRESEREREAGEGEIIENPIKLRAFSHRPFAPLFPFSGECVSDL